MTQPLEHAPRPASGSERLAAIDGLRAVAAMWVVLFHVRLFSGATPTWIPGFTLIFSSGYIGVSLFLVLSGFCLYLPFAAGRTGSFRAGDFLRRRCRRLLPAYYVSLAALVPMKVVAGASLGFAVIAIPQLAWQLITHVTFTHILFPSTFYGLNGPYWSLALEWQFYLTLPLVLLAVRRFGLTAVVLAVLTINVGYRVAVAAIPAGGLLPEVLANQFPGRWAEFALGMAAAELYARRRLDGVSDALGRRASLLSLLPLPLVALAAAHLALPVGTLLSGLAFFLLVLGALLPGGILARLLGSRPLVRLGLVSYSLYLIHQPIVQGMGHLLRGHAFRASPPVTFLALLALLPLVVGMARLLYGLVETPCLRPRRRPAPGQLPRWAPALPRRR